MSGLLPPVEKVAEAICRAEAIWPRLGDAPLVVQDQYRTWAFAAIAAIGLHEESCCDDMPDDTRAYRCSELGFHCVSRLAQHWPPREPE